VPVWYASRGNVIEKGDDQDWRAKRTYIVTEIEKTDENTGENPQPVQLRQINARLLLENDDPSDLEVLPLLKITRAAGEDIGLPRRDPTYIPPCFVVGGSSVLRDLLHDLTSQVMASRNELVVQINRGGFSVENMRGVQFEQMLRLRTLNRFSSQLGSLVSISSRVAPFQMYLMLRQLLAELAALRPDRDQYEVVGYDHDNLAVAFNELSNRIRGLLKGRLPDFGTGPSARPCDGGPVVADAQGLQGRFGIGDARETHAGFSADRAKSAAGNNFAVRLKCQRPHRTAGAIGEIKGGVQTPVGIEPGDIIASHRHNAHSRLPRRNLHRLQLGGFF